MDSVRDVALILVFQVRTSGRQAGACGAITAAAPERAPAARGVRRERLRDPRAHLGPKLLPRHLQDRERRLAIDHAMTRLSKCVDEKRDAPGAARVELLDPIVVSAD